jgi:hypothetical protein
VVDEPSPTPIRGPVPEGVIPEGALAFVLDRFNAMLESDGARLEVVGETGDTMTLRYVNPDAGPDGGCEACVLDPDDLETLVGEALQRQGAPIRAVTVVRA